MEQPNQLHHFTVHQLLVVLLVLFAFVMSGIVSDKVFEHLPHLEDEMAYLFQAKTLERGHLVIDTPQPRRAYWQPFVVDYDATGERFGKYSLGWPLLLAVGVNFGVWWIVNAWLAGLSVALVYRLGREIFNPDVGVIAAALMAFSPMALLLNGTLMSHTSALFFTLLFAYGYWRMERSRRHTPGWGIVAGLSLGMVVINRPAAGVAIAIPFVLWSGFKVVRALLETLRRYPPNTGVSTADNDVIALPEANRLDWGKLFAALRPVAALAAAAILVCTLIPIYNAAATGNPTKNLYLLVWNYDTLGFGANIGRHGHNLEKGFRQTRWDLSLTAADLFGWQTGTFTDQVNKHLLEDGDYYPNVGLSWVLLPFGLLIAFRQRWWLMGAWFVVGTLIILKTPDLGTGLLDNPTFSWLWLGAGVIWIAVPFAVFAFDKRPDRTVVWTWLLVGIIVSLIGIHIAYWIGSQRYSTRYYFEALPAFALLSALPLAWLARRWKRLPVYALLTVVLVYSLYAYSTPRISLLYRFNYTNQEVIQQVLDRRADNRPVLVIVTGPEDNVAWRAMGSLMALTSPYLDSPIVVAWDYDPDNPNDVRAAILKRFPDRQIVEMTASGNTSAFKN
jgi:hypothetical protein